VTSVRFTLAAAFFLHATLAGAAGPSTGLRTPDQEKLEAAADNIARMKAALKTVLGRAEQARVEKDVVKLNCVNEKLTQIKTLLRVAEQADVALHESLASRAGAGEAEFSKVAITRTKVDRLRREAEECIGQLAYMVDEKTTVEVEQPAGLPGREDTGLGIATRTENPADLTSRVGAMDDYWRTSTRSEARSIGIVRPPAASRYLP
jgi:hypothetical protein